MSAVTAGRVTVTDTLNGVPLTELVFTHSRGVASVSQLNVCDLSVTGHISVSGKVCMYNISLNFLKYDCLTIYYCYIK